jgi:hypothetical protein
MTDLTPASTDLFVSLVKDAGNWSGIPLYHGDKATNGNLADLKKKGLIKTEQDEDNRRCVWVYFTPEGKALATQLCPDDAQYLF